MDRDDRDDRIQRRAELLLWARSQSALRAGHPLDDPLGLWLACLADAEQEAEAALDATVAYKAPAMRVVVAETKDLTPVLAVKGGDDTDSSVEGYLAVFNNEDLVKDIIHPGAFAKTLQESKSVARRYNTPAILPLLWQHQKDEPIGGIVQADEDDHGLFIRCHLNRNIERGRQAYDGLKNGYMSFSIGYKPIKYAYKGNIRHLTEIALGEGSAVTFPANPQARAGARRAA